MGKTLGIQNVMKLKFQSEQELAAIVVARLNAEGWEVFQEVQVFGAVADIIARKDNKLWVIETKTTLNLDVLGQAYNWRDSADKVSIAVPASRRSRGRDFAYNVCRQFKIGIITVAPQATWDNKPYWYIQADYETEKINPQLRTKLESSISELHKTWSKAGSPSGGHLTPFKLTEMNVQEYVKGHPGCTFKELIDNIQTHYANPRGSVASAIRCGWIKNVTTKREGKHYKLYYEESK